MNLSKVRKRQMNKVVIFTYIIIFIITSSCQEVKRGLGFEKVRPDEFLIEKRSGLELPPDYNLIEPGSFKKKKKKETLTQILNKSLTPDKVLDVQNSGPVSNTTKSLEEDLLKKIK